MNLVLLAEAGDLQSLAWRYLGTSLMQSRYTNSEFPSLSFPSESIKTIAVVVVVAVSVSQALLTSGAVLTASVCPRRYWILGVTFCDIETLSWTVWGIIKCGQYHLDLIAINNKMV